MDIFKSAKCEKTALDLSWGGVLTPPSPPPAYAPESISRRSSVIYELPSKSVHVLPYEGYRWVVTSYDIHTIYTSTFCCRFLCIFCRLCACVVANMKTVDFLLWNDLCALAYSNRWGAGTLGTCPHFAPPCPPYNFVHFRPRYKSIFVHPVPYSYVKPAFIDVSICET